MTHLFPPPATSVELTSLSHSITTTSVPRTAPAVSIFDFRNAQVALSTTATSFQKTNVFRMASVGSDAAVGWHLQNLANSLQLSNRSRSEATGVASHHGSSVASGEDGEVYDDTNYDYGITGRAIAIESKVGGEMVSAQLLAQLRKANMSADDCDEIRERLLAFAQRY